MNARLTYVIDKPRQIADRKRLLAEIDSADILALKSSLKVFLKSGEGEIKRRFFQSKQFSAGHKAAYERAYLIDQIIRSLYDVALESFFPNANPTQGERLAIIALGGYGRGELAPFSDIDLLFIQGYRPNAWAEQIIEFILYRLWDLGLKPGYTVHTVKEALHWASKDLIAQTSFLEARYLVGDTALHEQLLVGVRRDLFGADVKARAFFKEKIEERDQRLARFGLSRYNLQPNLKEGKGGLRDLHLLRWLSQSQKNTDGSTYLDALEEKQFTRAEDMLWLFRTHLHYIAGRAEERLTFDLQAELTRRLGLQPKAGLKPVERVMRLYFRNARRVGTLAQSFLIRFTKPSKRNFVKNCDGFLLGNDGLAISEPDQFKKIPLDLMRIFSKAQVLDQRIGLKTLAQAQKAARTIDQNWRAHPVVNRLFLGILTSPKEPERWLHRLNEAGILGRFLPDFGRIVDQVQFDMYHHYTVDEHTIGAIGELNKLLQTGLEEAPPSLSILVENMNRERPALLFLAVLLHDIAKGRNRDHSEVGAEIAMDIGPRFGFNTDDTQTLSWLVRYHLLMSNTAFRRNLDDAKTIVSFAQQVKNIERLDYLLLLTIADIRAVGPKTWTSWKSQLLCDLYMRTREELIGISEHNDRDVRTKKTTQWLETELAKKNISDPVIKKYIQALSSSYLASFSSKELLHHFHLVNEREKASVRIEFFNDSSKEITTTIIVCQDKKGLVAQLTGAFALAGMNIVNAQISTLNDGTAIDVFALQNALGEPIRPEKFPELEKTIHRVLANPDHELAKLPMMPLYANPAVAAFPVVARVRFDNEASDDFTVIEISGRDKRGLIHRLAKKFAQSDYSIASAKVATFGHRAVDVFYVTDHKGEKIRDSSEIANMSAALFKALEEA